MSREAAEYLVNLGYTQVWDIPGGMNALKPTGCEFFDHRSLSNLTGKATRERCEVSLIRYFLRF